jgi:sulfoxide reductase catalytic subunit YedY
MSYNHLTHYNNFYEFGGDKSDPAKNAQNFRSSPWTVSVEGEVANPRKFSIEDILELAPLEERIYRHRCVEVGPWLCLGLAIPSARLPSSSSQRQKRKSAYDRSQMPHASSSGIDFPHVEGVRLDEALHPLTLLCIGTYEETLARRYG